MQNFLAAALLSAVSAAAWADASFSLVANGTAGELFDAYQCPGLVCNPPFYSGPFGGTASVVVLGNGADGTYSLGSGLVDITLDNTFGAGDFGFDMATEPEYPSSVSVVVSGGQVTSIDGQIGTFQGPNPDYTAILFSGLGYSYFFGGAHHGPTINASVTLRPVPEPSILALMAAGLVFVGCRCTRRSATTSAT